MRCGVLPSFAKSNQWLQLERFEIALCLSM
jgi:hypothetical protein